MKRYYPAVGGPGLLSRSGKPWSPELAKELEEERANRLEI
jgi:hypothetical protein